MSQTPHTSSSGTASGTGQAQQTAQETKQQARNVAGSATGTAKDVASTATDQASQVAHEAKSQARDLAHEARTQVRDQAGQQKQRAADGLRGVGQELGSMSSQGGQNGVASHLAQQAAGRVNGLADWLERHEPEDIVDEVRRFARRRPGTFLLGAAVAGLVAGRFTRGATEAAHEQSSNGVGTGYGQNGYRAGAYPDETYYGTATPQTGTALGGTGTVTGEPTGYAATGERVPTTGPLAGEPTETDVRETTGVYGRPGGTVAP